MTPRPYTRKCFAQALSFNPLLHTAQLFPLSYQQSPHVSQMTRPDAREPACDAVITANLSGDDAHTRSNHPDGPEKAVSICRQGLAILIDLRLTPRALVGNGQKV